MPMWFGRHNLNHASISETMVCLLYVLELESPKHNLHLLATRPESLDVGIGMLATERASRPFP